jgi:hypothetical protein
MATPPTVEQHEQFNKLKSKLAGLFRDLTEQEYNSLKENLKTHGATFWLTQGSRQDSSHDLRPLAVLSIAEQPRLQR